MVPRLVETGWDVVVVSRQERAPYQPHGAWAQVERIQLDRTTAEADGSFGQAIRDLEPDVVIDMICFTLASAQHLVAALKGQIQHLLSCGTVWVHGPSVEVPTLETQPRAPMEEYGIQKAAIETYLLDEARRNGFPATILHPGHIVGPGWPPLNPAGHFNVEAFAKLSRGEELILPNLGLETVHHVHADDVAQIFIQALANHSTAVGESFHAVSPAAVSLRGYAEVMATWFGQEANLSYLPFDEWKQTVSEKDADATWSHIAHSPNCSIEKGRRLLNYQPRYRSFEAVQEAVTWLRNNGEI
jgi:nucleoside-diphosphate-sugar epimerase